jgi:hypothetical protein
VIYKDDDFTPWIQPTDLDGKPQNPVREGVYQVLHISRDFGGHSWHTTMFCWWSGAAWGSMRESEDAARAFCIAKTFKHHAWRGLTEEVYQRSLA